MRLLGTGRIGVDGCVCIRAARVRFVKRGDYAQKQREGIILMSRISCPMPMFDDVRMSRALPFVKDDRDCGRYGSPGERNRSSDTRKSASDALCFIVQRAMELRTGKTSG